MHALTDAEFDEIAGLSAPATAPSTVLDVESVPPVASRIPLNAVHYLAFEGGGGKGIALVGAMQALEDLRLLRYANDGALDPNGPIKGVAGASAGAISATLSSCGYTAAQMLSIMNSYNFNQFWDNPRYAGRQSRVREGCQPSQNTQLLGQVLREYTAGAVTVTVAQLPGPIGPLAARLSRSQIEQAVNGWYSDARVERLGRRQNVGAAASAVQKLLAAPLLYLNNLVSDFGLFSGCAARSFFARLISERASVVARARGQARAAPSQFTHMTFAQHFALFRVRLALTGSNIATGKSEIFSVDTTPNFPVADAALISMSLPILFKPVIIRNTRNISAGRAGARIIPDNRLRGVWVDGGSFNNLPIRAFDDRPGANPKTFGIRLDEDSQSPQQVTNLVDYLSALVSSVLFSGESHVSTSHGTAGHAVSLNTNGLDTTEFNPPTNIRRDRIRDARAETLRYFRSR